MLLFLVKLVGFLSFKENLQCESVFNQLKRKKKELLAKKSLPSNSLNCFSYWGKMMKVFCCPCYYPVVAYYQRGQAQADTLDLSLQGKIKGYGANSVWICIGMNGNKKKSLNSSFVISLTFSKCCVCSHLLPIIVFRVFFPVGKG